MTGNGTDHSSRLPQALNHLKFAPYSFRSCGVSAAIQKVPRGEPAVASNASLARNSANVCSEHPASAVIGAYSRLDFNFNSRRAMERVFFCQRSRVHGH